MVQAGQSDLPLPGLGRPHTARGHGPGVNPFGSRANPAHGQHPPDLPVRIGPAEYTSLGALIAVRCPPELDPLMRQAGGTWEPGSGRWMIEPRRMRPLVHRLRRETDPLFRQAGIDLDGEG